MKTIFIVVFILFLHDLQAQTANWSVPTLKEYVDQRFNSMQEAVDKAETATEKRFDNTNEWRKSYEDLIKQMQALIQTMRTEYVPRTELASLERQIAELKGKIEKYETLKAGQGNTIAWLVGGFGLVIAAIALGRNLIAFLLPPRQVKA